MTPLLWGYPMGEKVLEKLLELGGDPNMHYDSAFGTHGEIERGDTLLFIAAKSTSANNTLNPEKFQNYVEILLKHGADPNLAKLGGRVPPLWRAVQFRSTATAEKLIHAGADIDWKDGTERSLVSFAAGMNAYPIMLLLLERGADYRTITNHGLTVAHILGSDYRFMYLNTERGKQYREVVTWMEARGMSIERGKKQWEQWQKMDNSNPKAAAAKFIAEVSEPEVARWHPPGVEPGVEVQEIVLPPGVEPEANVQEEAEIQEVAPIPAPAQQTLPQRRWNPLPMIAVVVILLLLAGGVWFWMRKGGKVLPR